jgi:predicted transcriptional regulator
VTDLLSAITSSEKRKRFLLLLRDGPKTWEFVKERLEVTASGMLPQIKILEEAGLVQRKGREYSLTGIGAVLAQHLDPLVRTVDVIEVHGGFWQDHDLSPIPPPLLIRLSDLAQSRVLTVGIEDLFESHPEFRENIARSRTIRGISPIFHPIYPALFLDQARRGVEITLILTDRVYTKILEDYSEMLIQGLQYENARLYTHAGDLRLALTVTDVFLSLGLFYPNGIYDSIHDLMGSDTAAIAWGDDLFRHYLGQSRQVNADLSVSR